MKRIKFLIYILIFFILSGLFLPVLPSFGANEEPTVNAPVALLMEMNSGKILYEKNARQKMYPASTTKIMTAILALENRKLSDTAIVSDNAISTIPYSYTTANLQLDETLTFSELLSVLLIPSANDAATVIAENISGSLENFTDMMNIKAKEIGCENTNFVNANGIHDENHYSTAYDLALIGQYAMKNETFRKLVSTVSYTLPATSKYPKEDRIFTTTNRLINTNSSQYYPYATGIKTGYTDAAKNCIVASAKKDDLEFLCVILGADNDSTTSVNKFDDCISLFDYGFKNYKYDTICSKDDIFKVISPRNASDDTKNLDVLYENDIYAFVKTSDNLENFSPEVELDENLKAPITKGSVIGKVSYTINDINYTTNLIAGQDILVSSHITLIFKIVLVLIALYLLKCILNLLNKDKRKNKRGKHSKTKKRNSKKNSHSSLYHFDY